MGMNKKETEEVKRRTTPPLTIVCAATLLAVAAWLPGAKADTPTTFPTYEATWESLNQHETPPWLIDAKLGLYAHWGVYSVPAYRTEWYGRLMYDTQTRSDDVFKHHIATYGGQAKVGYKDFVPQFKAEKFDAAEWARIFRSSGAKYIGITVVHHDGFCLWDTKFNRWNSAQMGPKRDIYGELTAALRKQDKDLKILTCFHHFRSYGWFFPRSKELQERGRKEGWDIFDPKYADLYRNPETEPHEKFFTEWRNKVKEVIDHYRPDVIWFDGGKFSGGKNEPFTLDVLAHFYNTQSKKGAPVEVINKKTNFPREFGLRNFEKGGNRPPHVPFPWVDDLNIAHRGWCYTHDIDYRSANEIVDGFIDRVSRGGGLMLSVSPKADGTIPVEQQKLLAELGNWLKINGEGIYGARRWKIETEGPDKKLIVDNGKKTLWNFEDNCDAGDIRFTRKGNTLYAFLLGWPENDTALIKSLGTTTPVASGKITRITMLGHEGELEWERTDSGLAVTLPTTAPCKHAHGLKIEVDGELK